MSSENLMDEKVIRKLLSRVWRQVIDLRADHEAYWKEVDWDDWEQKAFDCQTMKNEREYMDHKDVKG